MSRISRREYVEQFGPTVGDQIRLGDTDLWIEVEQDLSAGGEEVVFGGGRLSANPWARGCPRGKRALSTW